MALSIVESRPAAADTAAPPSAPTDIPGLLDFKADQYGVPRQLVHTVARMESNFDPNADSGKAQGLMQLEPRTAKRLGVTDPFDPQQNADAGVRLLAELIGQNDGDTRRVLAGYNAGQGAVTKYNGVPPYRETQNYVAKGMRDLPANVAMTETSTPQAPSSVPATPAASGIPAGVAQDIFARLARGEQVDTSPEAILQYAFGQPSGGSAAPAATAGPKLSIVESRAVPPRPAPPEPSVPQRVASAFWESSGKPFWDMLMGASRDPEKAKIAEQTFKQMVTGLIHEPERIAGEWSKAGTSFLSGDIPGGLRHTMGITPIVGGQLLQVGRDVDKGDYASAVGHSLGLVLPFAAEPVAGAVGEGVARGAEAVKSTQVGAGVAGAAAEMAKAVPGVPAAAAEGAIYGLPFGSPLTGAKLNVARQFVKAARRGWAKGVAEGAEAAPEAAAPEAAVPAAAAQTPGQAYAAARGIPWDQLTKEQQTMMEQFGANAPAPQPAAAPAPPETPAAAPPPAAPPMTATEMAQDLSGGRSPSKLSETQKAEAQNVLGEAQPAPPAAAPAPEAPPVAPAPAPEPAPPPTGALAGKPEAAAISRELEQSMRVERLTDFAKANDITSARLGDYNTHEVGMLAEAAGTQAPTAADVAAVRQNLAEAEAAREMRAPSNVPAEAQAQFARNQAAAPAPEPAAPPESPAAAAPPPPKNLAELMSPQWTPEPVPAKTPAAVIKAQNVELKAHRYAAALAKAGYTADEVAALEPGHVAAEAIDSGQAPGWQNVMHDLIADGLLDIKQRKPPESSLPRILELMREREAAAAPSEAIQVKAEMTKAAAEQQFEQAKQRAAQPPQPRPRAKRTPVPPVR
jgi:hypothetical protein